MITPGTVYLVGAGPGDPGLITRRGAEVVAGADVLVYDRLVHPDVVCLAREHAELIYAGKEARHHALKQEDINGLLVDRATNGKAVCRLKGGDPFVFGRGGEEAEACAAAGIPFEVIPGVTSAIAAAAYAGIPVTHREIASSFAVVTGHERAEIDPQSAGEPGAADQRRDWSRIAHAADTLIFLMGVESLAETACKLIEHGRAPDTAVALVHKGTLAAQRTLVTTLEHAAQDAVAAAICPPAITIVGEVVRLREKLQWFDNRPLSGRRIVVTRAREQAGDLAKLLRAMGAEPVEFPTIRIVPVTETDEIDGALLRVNEYNWLVFTSANTVRIMRDRLTSLGRDARAFAGTQVAAIGPGTAAALLEMGIRADFLPNNSVAEALIAQWPEGNMTGSRVLLMAAGAARSTLPDGLTALGARVDMVTAYNTYPDAGGAAELNLALAAGTIDAITLTSSSTVANMVHAVTAEGLAAIAKSVVVASIGPITSEAARRLGINPTIEAVEHTIPGLAKAVADALTREHKSAPGSRP